MNIIKFKDTIVDGQDWYNDNLRGRYAYWVRCRYAIPLNSITQNMYVSFETTINNLLGMVYYGLVENSGVYSYVNIPDANLSEYQKINKAVLVEEIPENPTEESPELIKLDHHVIKYADLWEGDYYWMNTYIDNTATDLANSVDVFKSYNSYVPSVDIDPEELKQFRTWLAESLLDMNYVFYQWIDTEYVEVVNPSLEIMQTAEEYTEVPVEEYEQYIKVKELKVVDWGDDNTHMLSYYAGGMYDDTLKWMSIFSGVDVTAKFGVPSGACGCGTGNVSSLYNDSVSVCDTVAIYRKGIKNLMVSLFSVIDTWSELPSTFIMRVKEYIDGIIQANYGLSVSDQSNYYSCECLNRTGQDSALSILKQLSMAFEYIAKGELDGHKNFITTVLGQWSNQLYEIMEWN